MKLIERIQTYLIPDDLKAFKNRVAFEFKAGRYTVKTAETTEEVCQALRLRYQVFYKKFLGISSPIGLDVTEYDSDADHLLVLKDKQIVGTYRLRCSSFTQAFFSTSEFNLGEFRYLPGVRLELSRACIDPEHRQGTVIACLWKGILKYAKDVQAKYLFGCVSIPSKQPCTDAAAILRYLKNYGMHKDDFVIRPTSNYEIAGLARCLETASGLEPDIPPLFATYLKMGARSYGEPCYDPKFRCIDFLTVLNLDEFETSYQRKLSAE